MPGLASLPWSILSDGTYRVLGVLGRGGSAVVMEAERISDGRKVAIKALAPTTPRGAAAQRRLADEARLALELSHPALVPVIDDFVEDGHLFLVMPRMQGSLRDWVERRGPVPPHLALSSLARVCAALVSVHERGVVHRDIKPANLLVDAEGALRLGDFGIAQLSDRHTAVTSTGVFLGTLAFMAPEQKDDARRVDASADIYSLGSTLYWMVTSELPFDLYVEHRRRQALGRLHPRLEEVIERCCVFARDDRWPDAGRLGAAMSEAASAFSPDDGPRYFHLGSRPPQGGQDTFSTRSPSHTSSPVREGVPRSRPPAWSGWVAAAAVGLVVGVVATQAATERTTVSEAATAPGGDAPPSAEVEYDLIEEVPACAEGLLSFQTSMRSGPREGLGALAADLDGDGRTEAVFSSQMDGVLSIYWGDGRNPLGDDHAPPTELRVGRLGGSPAVGDLDEDGRPDLLVPKPDEAAIAVWFGEEDRRFRAGPEHFQGGTPRLPLLKDWDGDGHVDAAFLHWEGLAVRRGDGTGALAPHRIVLSDIDGSLLEPSFRGATREFWIRSIDRGRAQGPAPVRRLALGLNGTVTSRSSLPLKDPRKLKLKALTDEGELAGVYLWGAWRESPLVRARPLGDDFRLCRVGTVPGDSMRDLADLNDDGALDWVGIRTCAGCPSNHMVGLGVRRP